jgi:hypothetical protein
MAGKHWLQQAAKLLQTSCKTAANELQNCCKQAAKLLQTSCKNAAIKLQKLLQTSCKNAAIKLQKFWLDTSCKAARLHNCPLPIICSADWLQLLTQLSHRNYSNPPTGDRTWLRESGAKISSALPIRAAEDGG